MLGSGPHTHTHCSIGLLVLLLNLLELLLNVEHVCFPHDLVLTLAVNFILLVLAL